MTYFIKYKKTFVLLLAFSAVAILSTPNVSLADFLCPPSTGNNVPGYSDIDDVVGPAHVTVRDVLLGAINWGASIVAVVAILMIVISGIMWAISSGDQDRVDKARRWLLGAILGLIIALAAWAIVYVIVTYVFPEDTIYST